MKSSRRGVILVHWSLGVTTAFAMSSGASAALAQAADDSTVSAPVDTTVRRIDRALTTGRVMARLVSRVDTSQRYALYLPSGYTTDRQWPVLFLMDPRGRAMVPMRWLQVAAEHHGNVVVSSGPAECPRGPRMCGREWRDPGDGDRRRPAPRASTPRCALRGNR